MSPLPELPDVIELIRPDDLLNLRIVPENLRLERDPPTDPAAGQASVAEDTHLSLVVDDPNTPALLRVIFPPQHIAEFAVFESDPTPKVAVDTGGSEVNVAREKAAEDSAAKPSGAGGEKPLGLVDPNPLPDPGTGLFKARIAAASRLVFLVPAGRRIPYTVEGLLDWRGLEPALHPIAALGDDANDAQRAAAPPISVPTADQTALELPYRLLISPGSATTWAHRSRPVGAHGRYELWHTRLVTPYEDTTNELDPEHPAPLRALWSPDYRPDLKREDRNREGTATIGHGTAGRSALSDDDRHQIVVLTSAFHGYETDRLQSIFLASRAGLDRAIAIPTFIDFNLGPAPYVPEPFRASQVMLSPLGGWLKSRGAWTPPRKTAASKPTRRLDTATSTGLREFYQPFVRAERGWADLRRFIEWPDFNSVENAAGEQLDLSEWIHVATQGRDHYVRVVYDGELWPFRHKAAMVKVTERKFVQRPDQLIIACLVQRVFVVVREPEKLVARNDSPLTKVRLTTRVTPNLTEPSYLAGTTRSFWVNVGAKPGEKFRFHAVGTDQEGREVDFTIPLIFASISDTTNPAAKKAIADAFNTAGDRAADFMGAKVAFTPLDGSDNPLLATRAVFFDADPGGKPPRLRDASITIPALGALLGNDNAVRIAYDDTGENGYAKKGYSPANTTGVFAKLVDTLPLGFRADQAGGFATPNQTVTALSRAHGPVAGDIGKAMADSFDPASVFPPSPIAGVSGLPLLFGTFGLDKLLLKGGSLSAQAPTIVTVREGDAIVTRLEWHPALESPVDVEVVKFIKNGEIKTLDIHGETRVPVGSDQPSSIFEGTLRDFDIVLLDSVTIHFTEFAFASRNGETPAVKVALDRDRPVEFSGDLQFVEELRKAIPPGLFGDGASLSITAAGIRAGFAIGLPPLEIGVFALKDVNLGAALTLPFLDGKPILDFNVSERASPFQLRVAFFAGGGFFHLQMDTSGMRQLEVALEFGAAFGLSIAVATGEVHAMAGIYFAIVRKDLPDGSSENNCTLTGFMRLGGRLSVIGLIRLSVEFNLSFTYQSESDKAYGRATVTVMVEVLFVSVSVSLTVERAFGGSADPVFLQTFPQRETWREYASAFA